MPVEDTEGPRDVESSWTEAADERDALYVVDRDPHVRCFIQQFVAEEYVVEFFDDGWAAVDRARGAPPCVLITELLVPRLDGMALCRLLKGDLLTQHIPILVLSFLAEAKRAMQAGADAFLEKPFERMRLLKSLRALRAYARPCALVPLSWGGAP